MQSILSGAVGQKAVRLNCTRSLSRLKSVFITLDKEITGEAANIGRKSWNDFYSPMQSFAGGYNKFIQRGEFEFQLQLGAKLYPEYPIRSHAEAFYQLRKTLGNQSNNLHGFDIDSHEYRNHKFILGTDMEKVLMAGFTGQNTRAGDILSVKFEHRDTNSANYATSMQIIMHADCIMEIRDGGVTVFD